MAIKLEKILNVSLTEYCKSRDCIESAYELVGVYHLGYYSVGDPDILGPKEAFAKKVPDGAEVVVGYTVKFLGVINYEANGTALIPREESKR